MMIVVVVLGDGLLCYWWLYTVKSHSTPINVPVIGFLPVPHQLGAIHGYIEFRNRVGEIRDGEAL